jgi:hypothetical protein
LRLVAPRRLARGQRHSGFRRKDVDHLERHAGFAALVGATQGFAVERHHAGKLDPIGFGEGRHEPTEALLEGARVERSQHATERVVAGDAVLQPQELPQHLFLGTAKQRHVGGAFGSAQHCGQSDDQDFRQIVLRVGRARIRQVSENLLESPHRTPLALRESSSESILLESAITPSNPHAIPLR